MEIDVKFNVKSINNNVLQTKLKGFYINYKKINYFVSVNHNFSISSININKVIKKKFTNCLWNEIVYFESILIIPRLN